MTRKCSHCGNNGHNSRTCPNRGGVKLFGVRLTDGVIRKSASMGNLVALSNNNHHADDDGYLSDGLVQAASSSNSRERKKGVPWSEEEHRMFLVGLQRLGKGDWRGISRNFVITRTPTQVASHAQKYFIRQSNMTRRKRRSSLFDMVPEPDSEAITMANEEGSKVPGIDSVAENSARAPASSPSADISQNATQDQPRPTVHNVCDASNQMQTQPLALNPLYHEGTDKETSNQIFLSSCPIQEEECESKLPVSTVESYAQVPCGIPVMFPGLMPPVFPFPVPVWSNFAVPHTTELPSNCNIVKPIAKVLSAPLNIDAESGISKLSIEDTPGPIEPSDLSLKLLNRSSKGSAFHASPSVNSSSFDSNSNAIHVN